ncbi:ABC transporter ATP-binding protein [Permianibacter aggregans]|nr:ATP-binding cassette domain-containing protein [Permianibacter aggregans]QGX40276.1 ATP-binding cassette domain-containing protein [Permianibacter aggregans]
MQLDSVVIRRGDFSSAPLSLTMLPGEKRVLLGSNGCGKTSLLLAIAGLLPVRAGAIHRPDCALSTGQLQPLPEWTVAEALHDGLGAQAEAAMVFWQLESVANQRLARLSLGFQQRVSLALATFSPAALVLLDEPANGLDPTQAERLHRWLAETTDKTVLLVSHQPQRLPPEVSQALLISEQGVQFDGPRAQLPPPWG